VTLRVWDSLAWTALVEDSAVTDADGRFRALLELDSLVTIGLLDGWVTPPLGSGLANVSFDGPLHFDQHGRTDTVLAFLVERGEGALEGRDVALASWRARGAGGLMRPTDLWVRVHGDAAVLTGVVAGADTGAPRIRITKTFVGAGPRACS
jgi:hypothetical protein